MTILCLVIAVTVSTWFSYAVLVAPVLSGAIGRWSSSIGDEMGLTLFALLATGHGVLALGVAWFTSVNAALIATSLAAFAWALVAYFLLQRFAGPIERCLRVYEYPMFHPLSALIGFIVCTAEIPFLMDWRAAFLPLAIWLILGFFCAEIAIRRCMRRSKQIGSACDRHTAIFMINDAQGRRGFVTTDRYPFP